MGNRTKEQLKKHYKEYQGTPEQIKKRSQRVMARRAAEKAGLVHKGDGKDVDHIKPIDKGGSNARSNLRVVSKAKNRGYKRDSKNNPI
jgi:5-methylcytosine-specific restriction endonuclease McrA